MQGIRSCCYGEDLFCVGVSVPLFFVRNSSDADGVSVEVFGEMMGVAALGRKSSSASVLLWKCKRLL